MPGVRIDRFLAATAIIALLSATGAAAEPKVGLIDSPAPVTAPPPAAADQSAVKPAEAPSESPAPPPAAKPQAAAERSVVAIAKPDDLNDTLAAPAPEKSDEPAAQPAVSTPPAPASEQPAAAAPEPQPAASPSAATPPSQPAEPTTATAPDAQPADPATTATAPAAPAAAPAAAPITATGGDEVPAAATAPAAAPSEPSATPAVAADPIAERLHELASGKFDRIVGKKDRASYESFYAAHNYAPLWLTDGKINARAKAAIAYLSEVDADGLDPADYPVPNFAVLSDPAALAEADLRLSASLVTYAHHASVGRVHWSRVSGDILYDLKPPAPAEVLTALADSQDVAGTLAGYEPQTSNYRALKAKLAELRGGRETGEAPFPNGPVPKIGMQDERVPLLRERLKLSGDGNTYDRALADAVKKFQQEHELKASGLLTQQTVDALNGRQPERPTDTVIANLERWRWMPHDLGKNYVIVNLPDFTLRVFHDDQQVWMTRIVTGKPTMPTPIMTAEMKFITVNPTWNVPPSIVAREYMPALAQDPTVLARMGLRVSTNPDGTVHISQPPGDANALGRLRFNFPNKFLVYQHDTPNKNLFALDKRAFSHGCMRVQDPVKYAEVLLSIVRPGEGYTQERIRRMISSEGEQDIQFPKFLPVNLTYQTAFVDEDGRLEFREDMYGRDRALLAILKGDERKVADIPVERRENSMRREALAMPEPSFFSGFGSSGYGGRGYYQGGGGNFFSRMFGSFEQPPQPPQPIGRHRAAQRRQDIQ